MLTDEQKTDSKVERSPEEIAADVALKAASAQEKLAQIRKLDLESEKTAAEVIKAKMEAELATIYINDAKRTEERLLATDENNHVFRFNQQVGESSVKSCIAKLSEWSRLQPGCDIEVIFSSPGGGIIQGMLLFDFLQGLRAAGHKVTTGCAGMAASMAGILLQAGDVRWIGEQSWLMIHRAAFGVSGKTFEVEDEVEFVKRIEERIIQIFVKRGNGTLTPKKIKANWDRKDWWLDAKQAFELGLVDEIRHVLP